MALAADALATKAFSNSHVRYHNRCEQKWNLRNENKKSVLFLSRNDDDDDGGDEVKEATTSSNYG